MNTGFLCSGPWPDFGTSSGTGLPRSIARMYGTVCHARPRGLQERIAASTTSTFQLIFFFRRSDGHVRVGRRTCAGGRGEEQKIGIRSYHNCINFSKGWCYILRILNIPFFGC